MNNKDNKTIVILGMHKTGTSLIAGILKILGVDMGKDLLESNWSNPLGHFEDKRFVQLNDKILKEAGGSWDNPPTREKILSLMPKFSDEIKKLINEREGKIWGWKDPRTSLTVGLYLPYLKNPYFIICHRDSMAVAKSLQKRDNMDIEKGLYLSKFYSQQINIFLDTNFLNLRKLDLKYEEILKEPKKYLENLISFLDITPSSMQYNQALRFILPRSKIEALSQKLKKEQEKIKKQKENEFQKKKKEEGVKYYFKKGIRHPWNSLLLIWKRFFK